MTNMTSRDMNTAKDVIPILPADAKAWELVRTILNWMQENASYNYREAAIAVTPAGKNPENTRVAYYDAIKRPYVQGMLLQRYRALDMTLYTQLEPQMVGIYAYQVRVANGQEGNPRDSTPAARFIQEHLDAIKDRLEAEGDTAGEHPAFKALRTFQKSTKVTATRVTETVEVTQDADQDPQSDHSTIDAEVVELD